jgi:hypothetical protein
VPNTRFAFDVTGQHRTPGFFNLQEQRVLLRICQQRDQAAGADAADPDHLERHVLYRKPRQKLTTVGLQLYL